MSIGWEDVVQRVTEYLDSQGWRYTINDSKFHLNFALDNQLEECDVCIRFVKYRNGACSVHTKTICPLTVPAEKEDRIVEFMTRANYGMVDGYFSYCFPQNGSEEGTLSYNSWLYCNDVTPSMNDVEASVDFPLHMMTNYGDALFNVLKHNADPEEEIQRVEGE